jgi:transposase
VHIPELLERDDAVMGRGPGIRNYSEQTRERAVRLARQQIDGDERSESERFQTVADQLGMSRETVRHWVRQAEIADGERPGPASAAEVAELRRRNAELEMTVEILKAATTFFARECDPRPLSSASSSPSTETGSESHRSVER